MTVARLIPNKGLTAHAVAALGYPSTYLAYLYEVRGAGWRWGDRWGYRGWGVKRIGGYL